MKIVHFYCNLWRIQLSINSELLYLSRLLVRVCHFDLHFQQSLCQLKMLNPLK